MPGTPQPGAEWAGFRIEERLGAGGFGQVFSAWDEGADRRVALKVVDPGEEAAAKERFLRESRLAAALDHPGIVPIHRVGEHEGMAFVVMRYVSGGDLAQRIHAAPLTLERTRSVLGQLGGALDRAHRAGLVHRGVEPANVLCVDSGDDVFLADFGAPSASVHHAAPEFVRGEVLTPATDVYGLGCTLFECLTGRVPFPGSTPDEVARHHLETTPPRVTDLRPDLPAGLDEIVARAMAKHPADRHATTRHLAEAVALVRGPDDAPTGTATSTAVAATAATAAAAQTIAGTEDEPETGPGTEADIEADIEVRRSVFDDTTAVPVAPTAGEPTTVIAAVASDRAETGDDDALDGAAFGIYEDERTPNRTPAVIAAVLVVATIGVGALVWRAVNTDAELATSPGPTTSAPSDDPGSVEPTVEAAEALVPEGVDTCVSPERGADDTGPILLLCPREGVPEAMSLELFGTADERDARVDALAAELGISDRDDAECALGRMGRHPYRADGHGGVVLCTEAAGVVDFVWTRDDAPVLLRAHGGGRFAAYERAWESLAGRTDGQFPLPAEQVLLDALPEEYLVGCERDLTLALETGGEVAAACRPTDEAPTVISWVLFRDGGPMDRWIADRRDSLDENNFDQTDDGCSPQGFGQVTDISEAPLEEGEAEPVSGPPPDAAFLDYDLEGTSGKVLCFINTSGLNAVFWTRDGPRIGSIAVSDRNEGDSMNDLLRWWRDGGHRP